MTISIGDAELTKPAQVDADGRVYKECSRLTAHLLQHVGYRVIWRPDTSATRSNTLDIVLTKTPHGTVANCTMHGEPITKLSGPLTGARC